MAGPAGGRGGGHRPSGGFSGGSSNRGGGHGYYHYGRGGLFGGIIGILLAPIIIMGVALIFLIVNLYTAITALTQGGLVVYDNAKLEEYANTTYNSYFAEESIREDGLMVFVIVHEDNSELSYVTWAGDNIHSDINNLFASDGAFGKAVNDSVNVDSYKFSLSKDVSKVMEIMTTEVSNLNLESSFVEDHDLTKAPKSQLVNKSEITVNAQTVNTALEKFTKETGIPTAVVIADAEDVYGRTMPVGSIIISVITFVVIGVCVFIIIRSIRRKKMIEDDLGQNKGPISFKLDENSPQ